MLQLQAFRCRHTRNYRHLVEDDVFHFGRRHLHDPPAETGEIGVARMCANGYAVGFGKPHCLPKHRWITCMEACSDIRGRDGPHQRRILAEAVRPKRFADIGVQINAQGGHGRELYKQKGTVVGYGAFLPVGLAPPAFTAPCRNQTDDPHLTRARRMPGLFSKKWPIFRLIAMGPVATLYGRLQPCHYAGL